MKSCPRSNHISLLYSFPILITLLLLTSLIFTVCTRQGAQTSGQTTLSDVPEWSKEAVWYQIFPERFYNGNAANDPTPADLEGSWPHTVAAGWQPSKWTGDWYELQSWEQADGKGFYFHAQQRRYGGDLEGVIRKLDYLSELGINAIYFNPLFESPSLHKYDATYYHHIDNNFGPDPAGDRRIWAQENPAEPATWQWTSADTTFLALIREAHRRNIRVVIDGVFNHTGIMFWAFRDLVANQENSPYKEWYTVDAWDDPSTPKNEFAYRGWMNVRELPELREDELGLVPGPAEHVKAVVRRWMDPNGDGNPEDGIDGWRLDVAEKVAIPFWKKFRQWVRELNPEAYIVGEVWWQDWRAGIMYNASPWLSGDVFDAVMNYRLAREAFNFFAGDKTKITSPEFLLRLDALRADYREQNNYALMNLYDSHDTDRIGSHIVNKDEAYDKNVGASDNRSYLVSKPGTAERETQKLMALFQMTYVGAPMIYYGTEVGMWGADDPDCRKPMLWSEFSYAPERSHPFGLNRQADLNVADDDLFAYYAALIRLRREFPVLSKGDFQALTTGAGDDVVAFHRGLGKDHAIVALNNARSEVILELDLRSAGIDGEWALAFGSSTVLPRDGGLKVLLGPKQGAVLVRSAD